MSAFSSPTVHEPGGAYAVMPTEGAVAGHAAQRGPRWYVANVREGDEASVARDCLKLIDRSLLADCFAPQALRLKKRDGEWRTEPHLLYPGRIFMVTCDPKALARELQKLSFWVDLVGEHADGGGYTPLAPGEQALFELLLDGSHSIAPSEGSIIDGELHVRWGPLKGQEHRVRKVNRHKRLALVAAGVPGCDTGLLAPLEVLSKT